ncbi:MASE4 domain-containing protein [Roseomonas xinghualingensis]|uniref:MASE4 domain-containing protein n=1 Tax=Roseomonas xinghualingensis TaxID=2986475 RepID=UPI0021F13B87|nr:MASE4 domain-containing protein [Roseomonas sp. SXEYE001]MCV4206973.1 MASE4 domain-containing protein [Roseomonas sp. SXEYE001]
MERGSADPVSASLASEPPTRQQRRAALVFCSLVLAVTLCLLPIAARPGPDIPAFVAINQTALISAYGLSTWVLFTQFWWARSLPLLLMAGGTLYSTIILLLQLLSFPGMVAPGRLLGAGPETVTWLWIFWHLGPPVCALAYAFALRRGERRLVRPQAVGLASALAALAAFGLAGFAALIATWGLPLLPEVVGQDYSAVLTSGVAPAVQALTLLALFAVWRVTRGRQTVLDLWLTASLGLLCLDNIITMAGGARGSVGWYVGRIEALASACVILWAYLHEVDVLRRRAETAAEEVARAAAALRQAQKMEAVGRLTGGIAHDFNNLLMVVTSGFDMIRRRPQDHARVMKLADAGLEAAQRGARLTRQLLTFARRQSLRPQTMNLNAALLDFEPLTRRALGEAVELDLSLHPGLHPTQVDPGEFEAAVLNLVVNARDAMPAQGGRITIGTRNVVVRQGASTPEGLQAGSYVVVSVTDNGSGMDEATRAQAFEPFFTTKEFGKGSGLGLSQVYGFARASGGQVEIISAPGRGTVVEIWLPRTEGVPKAAVPSIGVTSPLRRAEEGETVLAVEDEPAVLAAVVENLTDLGYRVLPARDAAEALERLRGDERVDVLFSDVVMPGGMNGVQLAVEAGRLRPGLRVLLTSGYANEALADQHSIPVDVPVLTKPYRREELAERLKVARRAG